MIISPDVFKLAVVASNLTEEDQPFAGPAGQAFLNQMAVASIPVDRVARAWVSDAPIDELKARGAEYIVLAGADAIGLVRPDLAVRECHGRAMLLNGDEPDGTIVFPVFHPEAFFRQPRWNQLLLEELTILRQIAIRRSEWSLLTPDTCVQCRGEFYRVDDQGVVYCEEHWDWRPLGGKLHPERTLTAAEVAKVFGVTVTN